MIEASLTEACFFFIEFFQFHFDQLLNPIRELILLANKIDLLDIEMVIVFAYWPIICAPTRAVRLIDWMY